MIIKTEINWTRLVIALVLLGSVFSVSAVAQTKTKTPAKTAVVPKNLHPVKFRYEAPKDPKLVNFQKLLQKSQLLEIMAGTLNETLRLPKDLALTAVQCGEINAFYSPQKQTVQICYEFAQYFYILHANDQKGPDGKFDNESVIKSTMGTIRFVMLHEIGHALVDILDLPITGREEDAVDQLAAVVLLSSDDPEDTEAVLSGAYSHLLSAASKAEDEAKMTEEDRQWMSENQPPAADEHSFDEQRFYNTACLAYGSKPEMFGDLVTGGILPTSRAERCPGEWSRVSRSWFRLLAPFVID